MVHLRIKFAEKVSLRYLLHAEPTDRYHLMVQNYMYSNMRNSLIWFRMQTCMLLSLEIHEGFGFLIAFVIGQTFKPKIYYKIHFNEENKLWALSYRLQVIICFFFCFVFFLVFFLGGWG